MWVLETSQQSNILGGVGLCPSGRAKRDQFDFEAGDLSGAKKMYMEK